MVEAAGVEPASENSGSLAPTCLALTFDLVLSLTGEQGTASDQPLIFHGPLRGGSRTLSSHHDAHSTGVSNLQRSVAGN